jgi:hypothetical protein
VTHSRFFLFVFLGLAACSPRGCDCGYSSNDKGCNVDLSNSAATQACIAAGGTCDSWGCGPRSHASPDQTCGDLFTTCCLPGAAYTTAPPPNTAPPPPSPFEEGTCNDAPCPFGCTCRPESVGDSGVCEGRCDCPSDAGADADADADANADAGVDADADADAGADADADAGADADADADAGADGAVENACGDINCAAKCHCLSQAYSICSCTSASCAP